MNNSKFALKTLVLVSFAIASTLALTACGGGDDTKLSREDAKKLIMAKRGGITDLVVKSDPVLAGTYKSGDKLYSQFNVTVDKVSNGTKDTNAVFCIKPQKGDVWGEPCKN